MFERLREAMRAAVDSARADPRSVVSQMRAAVIEARTSVEAMREGITATEGHLTRERRQLDDAERRGRLARGIQDEETVGIAERFATKHRERVAVLEQKLDAQRREHALAEREYEEMKADLVAFERTHPAAQAERSVESAWRNVEAAGGTRPDSDAEGATLKREIDRAAREARAAEQLEALKKKMGK